MNFKLKNFGKISAANIKLDGITVICGNNNTGKSTVGKALFSVFNSLCDYKNKIFEIKSNKLFKFIIDYSETIDYYAYKKCFDFIMFNKGDFTVENVKSFLENVISIKATREKISSLVELLNTPEPEIISENVFRYFKSVMNDQIKNTHSKTGRCIITAEFRDGKNIISLGQKNCSCRISTPIEHSAYYINSPFILDYLNQGKNDFRNMNPMDRSVISAIVKAHTDINEDSMSNILESVNNKNDLDEIKSILKKAYTGDTIISNGKYYYNENGEDFDIRNISAGLKSFALIERLLETGALKRKDVLILDEPEIHLHSEWQIVYAELIVLLQKKFDLTILIVTHSIQFLESLTFFMKIYKISERGNYYIPTQTENGVEMVSNIENLNEMKKNLKSGIFKLANMQLEELCTGDTDEENNE